MGLKKYRYRILKVHVGDFRKCRNGKIKMIGVGKLKLMVWVNKKYGKIKRTGVE